MSILRASLIDTEVCENPAALIIKPLCVFLISCKILTISPSTLDCLNSSSMSRSLDALRQSFSISSSVNLPYCACYLSPNRLRFGPFNIKTFLITKVL